MPELLEQLVPPPYVDAPAARIVPVHLDFLDGIRGLLALYVVLFHYSPHIEYGRRTALTRMFQVFSYGHYAVDVFIVISGFCLMLPVVRGGHGRIGGGIPRYLRRRALRILPPYYVALGLSVLCAMIRPFSETMSAGLIGSHLLLMHNFRLGWVYGLNGPMWSTAVEFQIYLLFPFLLLPLRRRVGMTACLFLVYGISLIPHFMMRGADRNFDWTFPWYASLFTLGMGGAEIVSGRRPSQERLRQKVPWAFTALFFAILVLLVNVCLPRLSIKLYVVDLLIGCAAVATIIHCCVSSSGSEKAALARLLAERPLAWIGAFSYSLYLTHVPALRVLDSIFTSHFLSINEIETRMILVRLAVGVPWALCFAFVFYIVVERRFIPRSGNLVKTMPNGFMAELAGS